MNLCANVCPPANDPNSRALHLPHPNDCTKFCNCEWGNGEEASCPEGLHFNAELQICDWPANANCQ